MSTPDTIVVRLDRLEEVEDFIEALNEWGQLGEAERRESIREFLQSPVGLTQYLEREIEPVVGRA